MNRVKISKDFSLNEFQCKDGSQLVKVDSRLIEKIQKLRDKLGIPFIINSGYRTPEYNKKVGGATNSQHVLGTAADISIRNIDLPIEVIKTIAKEIGFTGIGLYDTFIHLDVRDKPSTWDNRTKKGTDIMRKGSKGSNVKELQNKLNELGYSAGKADGIFGTGTESEVKKFQKDNKLTVDGIAGPGTLAKLYVKKN